MTEDRTMEDDLIATIERRFDRLEALALIGAKTVLDLDEAAAFTGYSKTYLYRQTSGRKIPHFKRNGGKLYFRKSELEEWMLDGRVKTEKETASEAVAYVVRKAAGKGARHV